MNSNICALGLLFFNLNIFSTTMTIIIGDVVIII
jgi:hypothetical protein